MYVQSLNPLTYPNIPQIGFVANNAMCYDCYQAKYGNTVVTSVTSATFLLGGLERSYGFLSRKWNLSMIIIEGNVNGFAGVRSKVLLQFKL